MRPKHGRLSIIIRIILILIVLFLLYYNFWYIDLRMYAQGYVERISESPDGAYRLRVEANARNAEEEYGQRNDTYAIVGRLFYDPVREGAVTYWSDQRSRIIFYDIAGQDDGRDHEIVWNGEESVTIDGHTVSLPNGRYDCRRDLGVWLERG